MKKIGVIVNMKRPHSEAIFSELRRLASAHGLELFAEEQAIAEMLGAVYLPVEKFGAEVEAVLAMGGDGTVLYTARVLYGTDVPILGINLGSLGFLTSVGDNEMAVALEALVQGRCKVSIRDAAECCLIREGQSSHWTPALNDVVLGWGASSRIVTLKILIDDEPVGTFMCDGIIVSTPTGSTGHSLSAGGPILHPGISAFGINVICPHTLSSRPLVVPNTSQVVIEVLNAAKSLILSIDGQDEYQVERGDRVEVRRSPYPIKFLQLLDHNYFSVLSKKLHWRGSSL